MRLVFLSLLPLLLLGCSSSSTDDASRESPAASSEAPAEVATPDPLASVLDMQPDDVKARYVYRNPEQTLRFIGVEPGMTVLEGLPGGGWYSRILMQYLGEGGKLLAANYSLSMYPLFSFANEEMLARQAAWQENWRTSTEGWGDAATEAFHFGSMPDELRETADVVFFPRVLHNATRFQNEGKGEFLDEILADAFAVLKPGGVLGIVQHEARPDKSDDWANGSRGYIKKSFVITAAEAAGFEFVAESDINENPTDQPGDDDIVWRLPPSLATSRDDEELRASMQAIGESNRMTLKFSKPSP